MIRKFLVILMCFAFVMPVYVVGAQEDEQETVQETVKETTQESADQEQAPQKTAQKPAPAKTGQLQIPKVQGTAGVWINKIIAYISQIGGLFGQTLGFRIGGTTGTAIAALLLAKFLENKVPPWIKYLLYLTGGTMFAGSGANITQVIMQVLNG